MYPLLIHFWKIIICNLFVQMEPIGKIKTKFKCETIDTYLRSYLSVYCTLQIFNNLYISLFIMSLFFILIKT